MPSPDIWIDAVWYNDGTAGLAITCKTCAMDILYAEEDTESMRLEELNERARKHECPPSVRGR